MNSHFHAILWIDHHEAKIFPFSADEVESRAVAVHGGGRHEQHKASVTGAGHQGIDREFFGRVADALSDVGALLITGPGQARLEFSNYPTAERADIAAKVSAVEALDHPSDAARVALGRRFFKADDRMHAQRRR